MAAAAAAADGKPQRRVVVTGQGVVTSLGHTPEEFYNNLLAGKSGIGMIEGWDTGAEAGPCVTLGLPRLPVCMLQLTAMVTQNAVSVAGLLIRTDPAQQHVGSQAGDAMQSCSRPQLDGPPPLLRLNVRLRTSQFACCSGVQHSVCGTDQGLQQRRPDCEEVGEADRQCDEVSARLAVCVVNVPLNDWQLRFDPWRHAISSLRLHRWVCAHCWAAR